MYTDNVDLKPLYPPMRETEREEAPPPCRFSAWSLPERLGSLKITLVALILLCGATFALLEESVSASWLLPLPLFLLSVNLASAVFANAVFRRQSALVAFHLSLALLVFLAALSRLTYMEGHVEVTEGTEFDYALAEYESGPWHDYALDSVRFRNDGFAINYHAGVKKQKTYNRVTSPSADGGSAKSVVIGDDRPLVQSGYRFYTTSNKGFAPVFTWYPAYGSAAITGSVNFPSYPLYDKKQFKTWDAPGGVEIYTKLLFDEIILDPAKPSRFRTPQDTSIIVRVGDRQKKMKPGDSFKLEELPGGTLVYREMRTWMGYLISYDRTAGWMLAVCVVASSCLLWYYVGKFRRTSWMTAKK